MAFRFFFFFNLNFLIVGVNLPLATNETLAAISYFLAKVV